MRSARSDSGFGCTRPPIFIGGLQVSRSPKKRVNVAGVFWFCRRQSRTFTKIPVRRSSSMGISQFPEEIILRIARLDDSHGKLTVSLQARIAEAAPLLAFRSETNPCHVPCQPRAAA